MKLCIDCDHCKKDVRLYTHAMGIGTYVRYGHETCALTDAIYGDGRAGMLCIHERDSGACGPDATRFVPRPPAAPVPAAPKGWFRRLFA